MVRVHRDESGSGRSREVKPCASWIPVCLESGVKSELIFASLLKLVVFLFSQHTLRRHDKARSKRGLFPVAHAIESVVAANTCKDARRSLPSQAEHG
jgi:hypothetical protein